MGVFFNFFDWNLSYCFVLIKCLFVGEFVFGFKLIVWICFDIYEVYCWNVCGFFGLFIL